MGPTIARALLASLLLYPIIGCGGEDGLQGPAGPQGQAGAKGDPGDDGQDGQNGQNGQNGQDGQNGQNGQNGSDGQSAWVVDEGLTFDITAAAIDQAGVATVDFTIGDSREVPLDREGRFTPSAVSVTFILGWLGVDAEGRPLTYRTYTTREVTSPITNVTATQSSGENNGTFVEVGSGEGTYRYTFRATADPSKRNLTHTVAAYATRTVDGVRAVAEEIFSFVPDGTGEVVTREIVTESACNGCHQELTAHGGARRGVQMCTLCHTPQTSDPDTGNTVDLSVMTHRIHRGANLPSVESGTPYIIIGHSQSVHDYSTVHYPQEIRTCERCHDGADGDLFAARPSVDTCLGSCHDNVAMQAPPPPNFEMHGGGAQPANAPCNVCHPVSGSLAGIRESHAMADHPNLAFEIQSVTNSGPGQTPIVTFRVTAGGTPRDIIASPLSSLSALVSGPNSDFSRYFSQTIQGNGARATLTAVDAANGVFQAAFLPARAMPADATGSWTLGLEGYITEADGTRNAAYGAMFPFAVTDESATARRQVVDNDRCDSCHDGLAGHGGGRKGGEYCTMCHMATNVGEERASRIEGTSNVLINSVDLKVLVHRIHMGEELSRPYVVGGYPPANRTNPAGNPIDFSHIRYPQSRTNCEACHESGTYELPLDEGLRPVTLQLRTCTEDPARDGDAYCDQWVVTSTIVQGPAAAACTGCHDDAATAAHAEVNTTVLGNEACAVCHGPGADHDVLRVHGLD